MKSSLASDVVYLYPSVCFLPPTGYKLIYAALTRPPVKKVIPCAYAVYIHLTECLCLWSTVLSLCDPLAPLPPDRQSGSTATHLRPS